MNMNLYIVSVDLINGLYPIVLDVLSLIAIFVGILVITTKNPVYTPPLAGDSGVWETSIIMG